MNKRVSVAIFFVASAVALILIGLSARLSITHAHTADAVPAASVAAFKIASTDTARPGDLITYTIVVYNTDRAEAADVLMVDVIPPHTTYVTHTIAERVVGSGTVALPGTGTLPFTNFIYLRTTLGKLGTVLPPWVTLATLTVRVEDDFPGGRIVNTALFWVNDEEEPLEREATTVIWGKLFLPLIMRNY